MPTNLLHKDLRLALEHLKGRVLKVMNNTGKVPVPMEDLTNWTADEFGVSPADLRTAYYTQLLRV